MSKKYNIGKKGLKSNKGMIGPHLFIPNDAEGVPLSDGILPEYHKFTEKEDRDPPYENAR